MRNTKIKACFYSSPITLDFSPVGPGRLGGGQPKGHVDAVQRNPILMEERQARLCEFKLSPIVERFIVQYLVTQASYLVHSFFFIIQTSPESLCVVCCLQLVWVVTCLAACLLGLDLGLAVGLGVELLTVVFRTQL